MPVAADLTTGEVRSVPPAGQAWSDHRGAELPSGHTGRLRHPCHASFWPVSDADSGGA